MPETQATQLKLCGLTRVSDAQRAVDEGIWALGFVFYPPSPRAIEPEAAAQLIQTLQANVEHLPERIGVFVNRPAAEINSLAEQVGLTYIQLHGDESPQDCAEIKLPVIKALRLRQAADLKQALAYQTCCELLLVDAAVAGEWGGTGVPANWQLARELVIQSTLPVILAGGLNPNNIQAAAAAVRPWGLDLSSGVEQSPGRKDPERVDALFAAYAQINQKHDKELV